MGESVVMGNWNYPSTIRAGSGSAGQLADACTQLSISSPLLVTDPGLAHSSMVEAALARLREAGLQVALFSEIKPNPTGENVDAGVACYRQGEHDGVVALGGGSSLDAAKAIALMAGQHRPLWDFEDMGENWRRVDESAVAPLIALPTTAGTGSEVGRAAIITDQLRQVKKIIFHPRLLPSIVLLDPQLTAGLPPVLTAATGMDALSHNLEALCSPAYHPMADGIALEGIRLIHDNLPLVVSDGNDLQARMHMLSASSMGATAFQKGLGAMHALAHPLGALYDAHHGMLNAILMPYVLKANRDAIDEPITRCARHLGLEQPGFELFMEWVLALREDIGIPHTLASLGIGDDQAQRVGQMAVADPSGGGNPVAFDAQGYTQIFCAAIEGRL